MSKQPKIKIVEPGKQVKSSNTTNIERPVQDQPIPSGKTHIAF
jgi:hypothetical protein